MKTLIKSIQILPFILLSVNCLVGQSNLAELAITASVDFDDEKLVSYIKRDIKKKKTKSSDVYFDISDVDLSTTINVASNELDFSGLDNRKFTKIQLTNKSSNKSILSRKIESNYKIDLNILEPGIYILMFSNAKGELKTEELIIF